MVAVLWCFLSRLPAIVAGDAALDLALWRREIPRMQERIEEMILKRTSANGTVRYVLLVSDGPNYVVKIAPTEKLLRARILTPEIDVAGRCGDEIWVAKGRLAELRFLRDRDLRSKETNYAQFTASLQNGVAKLGRAVFRLGTDPLPGEVDFRLTGEGWESSCPYVFENVVLEQVHTDGASVVYQLRGSWVGDAIVGGISRFRMRGTLEDDSYIPSAFRVLDDSGAPTMTVDRVSLKRAASPIPLRRFRPEPYVLEGFHTVVRMEGDRVIHFPAWQAAWRKIVVFGLILPYRWVKWSVIVLIAVITLIAAVYIGKRSTTTNQIRS